MSQLRKALRRDHEGPVKVLVALDDAQPGPDALERLRGIGLLVTRQVGNKLIGTIAAEQLADLRRDPAVTEVEVSSRLRPS